MDEDDMQQFSLRWHNHQNSVIGALGRMLNSGALADVILSANGTTLKAHRLVLASCSQYFAQLFKELESESGSLVIVLGCEVTELQMLLTFMYTGEVTASRRNLPSLLKLAQTLKVSGLTDANSNATVNPTEAEEKLVTDDTFSSPINLQLKADHDETYSYMDNEMRINPSLDKDVIETIDNERMSFEELVPNEETVTNDAVSMTDILLRNEKDRLSKLDQIVQNLYSTHKIVSPTTNVPDGTISHMTDGSLSLKSRTSGSVCGVCHKRLSNQYNLRVHLETHAGTRHRCHACSHVSRSRDALRKHVAYRHPQRGTN